MTVEQGKISRRGADAVLNPSPEADPSPPPQPPHSFQGEHGRVTLTLNSWVSFPPPFPTCRFKTHPDSNVSLEEKSVNICNPAICICWRGMRTLKVCLCQLGRAGTTTSLYLKPLFQGFYLNQVRKLHHHWCGFPNHNIQKLTSTTSPRTAFPSPLAILLIMMSGAIKRHSTRACLSF